MGNQNIKLIGAEHDEPKQTLNIVTRSGLATNGGPLDNAKNNVAEWVRRSTAKSPTFDLQREKEAFFQVRRDYCDAGASSSKVTEKGKVISNIPLQSDPLVDEAQHQVNIMLHEETDSTGLVKSFP